VRAERASARGGFTLLETMIALCVLAFAALTPLSSMVISAKTDGSFRQRSVALRAALVQLDRVMAFDYGDDIGDFVLHWNRPENRSFSVPELSGEETAAANVGASGPTAAVHGVGGAVEIDASDLLRVVVIVRVDYRECGEPRQVILRHVVTEVAQ